MSKINWDRVITALGCVWLVYSIFDLFFNKMNGTLNMFRIATWLCSDATRLAFTLIIFISFMLGYLFAKIDNLEKKQRRDMKALLHLMEREG